MWYVFCRVMLLSLMSLVVSAGAFAERPRVIVSTDIGGSDNDDYQSMVHLLVYADVFDIEGLISSPAGEGRKSHIEAVLNAYKADYPKLQAYGPYPTYAELLAVTAQGAVKGGAPGSGKSTDGSVLIMEVARVNDGRPLWILVWGAMTDIAQALYDAPDIENKIRVYAIGSRNTTNDPASRDYIYNRHPNLWWIETNSTFRGIYLGGNQKGDLSNITFVSTHVKGHGALGNFYYTMSPKDKNGLSTLKMGDSPSVFYLLSPLVGGVGSWNNPTTDSWGGKFKKTNHGPNYWTDITGDHTQDRVHINKWREQYLRHFQSRMDRCR